MAAKKTATKKKPTTAGTTTKVSSGSSATKKASAPKVTKSPAAETSTKTKPAPKTAAKKPLKLSDAQEKFLVQIESGGEAGYTPANKTELRSMEKLRELKLVKRGAKDKATGNTPYLITATGKKHLAAKA